MVSEQMDMLDEDDARPGNPSSIDSDTLKYGKIRLLKEIAENGEAIVTFEDGRTVEFHGDDTHFYPTKGVLFTETETPDGEEAESWFFADRIVSVQRH